MVPTYGIHRVFFDSFGWFFMLKPYRRPTREERQKRSLALSLSTVGLELGASITIGALLGRWLDGKWGTEPWLLLTCFMLGLIAGFLNLYRATQRIRATFQNQPDDDLSDSHEPK